MKTVTWFTKILWSRDYKVSILTVKKVFSKMSIFKEKIFFWLFLGDQFMILNWFGPSGWMGKVLLCTDVQHYTGWSSFKCQ